MVWLGFRLLMIMAAVVVIALQPSRAADGSFAADKVARELDKSRPLHLDPKIAEYFKQIHAEIAARLRALPDQGLNTSLQLQFYVDADGAVRAPEVRRSSGSASVDQLVLSVLIKPLPPWPRGVTPDPKPLILPVRFRTLMGVVRDQLASCWVAPKVGMPVTLEWGLARDGSVTRVKTLSAGSDEASRDLADAAMVAVRKCAPFQLPPEEYEKWRTIRWTFDPQQRQKSGSP